MDPAMFYHNVGHIFFILYNLCNFNRIVFSRLIKFSIVEKSNTLINRLHVVTYNIVVFKYIDLIYAT